MNSVKALSITTSDRGWIRSIGSHQHQGASMQMRRSHNITGGYCRRYQQDAPRIKGYYSDADDEKYKTDENSQLRMIL